MSPNITVESVLMKKVEIMEGDNPNTIVTPLLKKNKKAFVKVHNRDIYQSMGIFKVITKHINNYDNYLRSCDFK